MRSIIPLLLFITSSAAAQNNTYPVHYFSFTSQNQKLQMAYVYEQSATPNGKTIILLHGKNFSHAYWNETTGALLKRGYDVLVPDQVGFGLSSKPTQYQYSFQQLAMNTRSLADTLKINQAIILGHSMGGMIAVRYALMYPDCRQLILEDPLGLEDWKLHIPYSPVDTEYKKELAKTPAALKKYMLENYFHNEWKPAYDTLLAECTKNLTDSNFAWNMALTTDMIFTQPVYYELANLKVPAVLIIGSLDRTAPGKERAGKKTAAKLGDYPKLSKEAAAVIPHSRLMVLDGLGHIPHVENFSAFINALQEALYQ